MLDIVVEQPFSGSCIMYVCIVFLHLAANDQLVVITVLCYILIYIKFQGPLQDNETCTFL